MQRDATAYLWDIADAAERIRAFTQDKALEDYLADEILRAAVERKFSILGEALSKLLQMSPQFRSRITLPEQIVAFRNQLIHGYPFVNDRVVWEIVRAYLPQLHAEIAALLGEQSK